MIAAAEEIPAALRDHWEDVTTAMHDADARHLYVDVAEPLADASARSLSDPRRRRRGRRGRLALPRPDPDLGRAHHRARPSPSSRRSCAPATGSSSPSRTAARPSAPATT